MVDNIKRDVRDFIISEFLPGEDPGALTDDLPLITSGLLDSLSTVKLVLFIEKSYGIEIAPHETGVDYLNSLDDVARLIEAKRATV